MRQQLFKGRGTGTELGPDTRAGVVRCCLLHPIPGPRRGQRFCVCASQSREIREREPEKSFSWRESNGKQKAGDVLLIPVVPNLLQSWKSGAEQGVKKGTDCSFMHFWRALISLDTGISGM